MHTQAKAHGIKRRWLVKNLGLIALVLFLACMVFTLIIYYFYRTNMASQLSTRANASQRLFQSYINGTEDQFIEGAKRYAEDFVDKDKMEFEVVGLDGVVLCSSFSSVLTGFVPGTPDVAEALRYEHTSVYSGVDSVTGRRVMSVSTPVYLTDGETIGAIRYVSGLGKVNDAIVALSAGALGICALIFVFVLLSNLYFIRSIVNPVRELNSITKQIAEGEYGITIEKKYNDEIGELADSINFMSGEINRSAMIKNDFISSVSHELRTPLTAITGWTETLMQSELAKGQIESRGLDVISKEAVRLRDMVEELLDFSRMESGRMVINRAQLDIKAELIDTIGMYEQRMAQDNIHVIFNAESTDPISVLGDRSRLRQVFVNILDNARKYSPSGSAIEVFIADDAHAGTVEIEFADHGIGISPTDLPHVKEKFYKGKANRPGSGIGLAISDEIVSMHGGKLEIDSVEGEGTTVRVVLPLRK